MVPIFASVDEGSGVVVAVPVEDEKHSESLVSARDNLGSNWSL